MSNEYERIPNDPAAVTPALNEDLLERSHGTAIPDDGSAALAAWLAFEQGALSEAPKALAAWLDHQRFSDAR